MTKYFNATKYPTELKTSAGEVIKVNPNEGAETTTENPFTKQRFLGFTGWKKIYVSKI
jgi:hypothetical protein